MPAEASMLFGNSVSALVPAAAIHTPGEEPAILFGDSVSALTREIERIYKENERAGYEVESPEFLEAYRYYILQRSYPNDSVDWSAWSRAADFRDNMQSPAGKLHPEGVAGKWQYVGPRKLHVPQRQYFGKNPVSGRVNGAVFDPTHPGTYYISASGGGVWKTTDGGVKWKPLSNDKPWKFQQTGSMAIDPRHPKTLFVAANDPFFFGGGTRYVYSNIMRTLDGGDTWGFLNTAAFGTATINKILVDPDTDGLVMAVTGTLSGSKKGKIWRSTDNGTTWKPSSKALAFWTDIVCSAKTGGGDRYYWASAFTLNGYKLFRSSDRGITWKSVPVPLSAQAQLGLDIAASALNAKTLYVLAGTDKKILKTTNAGVTWQNVTNDFPTGDIISTGYNWSQYSYDYFIGCSVYTDSHGVKQDAVYVGLIDVAQSLDGGKHWRSIGGPTYGANALTHNDQHAWAVNPNDPNDMLVGNDGGVYHLVFKPATGTWKWTPLNATLGITTFYRMDVAQAIDGVLIGGAQDSGTPYKASLNGEWQAVSTGDGNWSVISVPDVNIQYAASYYDSSSGWIGMYRTADSWGTSTNISLSRNANDPNVQFVSPIIMSPGDPNSLFCAADFFFRHDSTTDAWTQQSAQSLGFGVLCLAAGCAGNTIYSGALDGTVGRSTDAGQHWSFINNGLPIDPNTHKAVRVTAISVDPGKSDSILVGVGGSGVSHLWQCLDTSVANPVWTSVGHGLPDLQLNAIARDPSDPVHTWYVGTDVGVMMTEDSGATWTNATRPLGLPNVQVSDLRVSAGTGYLYAATFGRGIWRIKLTGDGAYNIVDLDLSYDQSSQAFALNHSMQIAGTIRTNVPAWRGQFWKDSKDTTTWKTWATLPGGTFSYGLAINAAGSCVGYADTSAGVNHAVIWFPVEGKVRDLEEEDANRISSAFGINDDNIIVGQRFNNPFIHLPDGTGFWNIGTFGGASGAATGINNASEPEIVGYAQTATGNSHAFRHQGKFLLTPADDLGTLGGNDSKATAINDPGQVVGYSTLPSGATHAFRTAPKKVIDAKTDDLGSLGGDSFATAISDTGLVVGRSYDASGNIHAFIWDQYHGMQDLNNLIPANSGWTLVEARGICDCGCIVGYGRFNNKTRAFMLSL